ncbi:hypothetical protein [Celeribacter sp.]|uniref:hypothetical protein n=1 Tax=Celeribacter sp. TaxID=1890673 RepID=UPI003A917077
MTFKRVEFPTSIRFRDLCAFSCEVDDIPQQEKVQFGTEKLRFFTPTSMTMFAKTCRARARKFKTEQIFYTGLRKHDYANNLGFSEALNLKGNPYPQGAFGGSTYHPMSALRRTRLESLAAEKGIEFGDAIQIRSAEIAEVVSQLRSPELQNALADSFREIFRNTFEHAGVSGAMFCAQYWPTKQTVEICISDRGMGLAESLAENPRLEGLSDREALYMSLMPGISSKAWRHKKKKAHQRSDWDNTGHGLFFAHRLFGQLGKFAMASGNQAILIERGGAIEDFRSRIAGTVVSMQLDLSDVDRIQQCIVDTQKLAFKVKERLGVKNIEFKSVSSFLKGEITF